MPHRHLRWNDRCAASTVMTNACFLAPHWSEGVPFRPELVRCQQHSAVGAVWGTALPCCGQRAEPGCRTRARLPAPLPRSCSNERCLCVPGLWALPWSIGPPSARRALLHPPHLHHVCGFPLSFRTQRGQLIFLPFNILPL